MKKKHLVLTLILLITTALLIGGCGTNKAATEKPANDQASNNQTEQTTPAADQTKQWDNPPAMEIDTNKSYSAELTTTKGTFTIELFAKEAPKTVNNFVFLSRQGYYDNVIFHRIIESFMIQTGDPTGTGMGNPGYKFEDEKTNYTYEPGIVAMANAGPDTNGSQFFICTGEDSVGLNSQPNYTIFGKVTDGMDVVKQIAATPVDVGPGGETSSPTETIQIKEIKIVEK
ncbi:putative peptidyl-prolyl cis-trans isomerase [compost metagenome]